MFPAELGLAVSVSTLHLYDESRGRDFERVGGLPDIVTTSEEALTTALEHARGMTSLSRNRHSGSQPGASR